MVLVSALLAAFTALVVFLGGFFAGRRTSRAIQPAKRPICSCEHGYGTHDEKGRCYGEIKRTANSYSQWVRCPCRRYDGPEVVASFWVPPIASGGD